MKRRLLVLFAAFALASSWAPPIEAVDLRDVLTDYTLASWGRKDGLTGPVWALAQDPDGFLWLGTDVGLMRFDGVRFVSWESLGGTALPPLPVRALRVASDGSLWVGFGAAGGIVKLSGKAVRLFTAADDAETGAVTHIVEDRDHSIWAAGANGLYRFASGKWQRLGADHGLPDIAATAAYLDVNGRLWIGTGAGLFVRNEASGDRFEPGDDPNDPIRTISLSQDRAGRLWASDSQVGLRAVGAATTHRDQPGRGWRVLHDREGNRWVGTIGQGLWRIKPGQGEGPDTFERATVLSGLSSDAVRSIYEDRDGTIWAGTTEGVDRLVPHRITPWALGIVSTIDAASGPGMWVGTDDELIRFGLVDGAWQPGVIRIPVRGIQSVRTGNRGRTWVSTSEGLFRVEGTTLVRQPFPPGVRPAPIEALAADPRSGVWVIVADGIVLRDDGSSLSTFTRIDTLRDSPVLTALADRKGRLWMILSGGRIGVLSGLGEFQTFGPKEGVTRGPLYSLHEGQDGSIWVSGADELLRFDNTRFVSVTRGNGLPNGLLSLTDDDQRNLWLATAIGIARLPIDEFNAGTANPSYRLKLRIYDTSDGLAGYPVPGDRHAVRAGDGTLWFITSRGTSMLDPRVLSAVRPMAHVTIDQVLADDRPTTDRRLPAGTAKVQVDYTAPELTYPLKTRFRYRLDGFDDAWIEAGNRRQALYTNLPPRDYAFRVAVSSDEGGWSELGAPLAFSIAPRFYQTWWFYPTVAVTLAGLLGAAWQLRLRQLRRQFGLVLAERVRLSRELHDTLLQSLVGVALEFDAVSKSLESSPATAKARVVKIREHVEEYIREARRSIWSLRSPALETGDLLVALRESAERVTEGNAVQFNFTVNGTPRRLPSSTDHQLLRIGQEAVLNAVRHATPQHIQMTLSYSDDAIALRVVDDGRGFDSRRAPEGTTDHYGITTMRERAQQAGGQITISSEPGRGTIVEAVVPTSNSQVAEQYAS